MKTQIRGFFNRASVPISATFAPRHMRKLGWGAGVVMLALPVTRLFGLIVLGLTSLSGVAYKSPSRDDLKAMYDLNYNGKAYVAKYTFAQAFFEAQDRLDTLKESYEETFDPRKKKRLNKRSQKVVNYLDDLIDSRHIQLKSDVKSVKKPMKLIYKNRSLGN